MSGGVALDKSEGPVKNKLCLSMYGHRNDRQRKSGKSGTDGTFPDVLVLIRAVLLGTSALLRIRADYDGTAQ